MFLKLCFGSPKRGHFLMHAMHQIAVPDESKHKEENKRCDECDKEFFPVHNFFLLRFLLSAPGVKSFIAKSRSAVDLKFAAGAEHALASGRDWHGRQKTKAETTKPVLFRHSDFVILSSSDIRHCIRFNVQTQLAQKDYVYVSSGILRG
jgi:hypothetical protein